MAIPIKKTAIAYESYKVPYDPITELWGTLYVQSVA